MNRKNTSNNVIILFIGFLTFISANTKTVSLGNYIAIVGMVICFVFLSYSLKKNAYFYVIYTSSAICSLLAYLVKQYVEREQNFEPVIGTIYILYTVILVLFFVLSLITVAKNRKKENRIRNVFSERKYDLQRLADFIGRFSITGLDSVWGDGKTYLFNLFKQKYCNNYFFISIYVMTTQTDTIEKFIVNELNSVLKQDGILTTASNKLNNFLQTSTPYGIGNLFIKNTSYTKFFEELIEAIEKISKPIVITFEDIDRIENSGLVWKLFSITEWMASRTEKLKIVFQYDKIKLLTLLQVKSNYIEKYIPYSMKLTPIAFQRCLTVLLNSGKKEKKIVCIDDADLTCIYQDCYLDDVLQKMLKVNKTLSLTFYFSIRSVTLYLTELDTFLQKSADYAKDYKHIAITFFAIKHFFADEFDRLSFDDRFIDICSFDVKGQKYTIFELEEYFFNYTGNTNDLFDDVFLDNSTNLHRLIFLHLFGYKFDMPETVEMDKENIVSVLNESCENIEVQEHNDKIDRLIWNLLANGKSELTDKENVVKELEKILDEPDAKRNEAYDRFFHRFYYDEFEKPDNANIFRPDISNYIPLFQGFRIYEHDTMYWVKLIDFYFEKEEIITITPDLIHVLNYCDISERKVFIHIVSKFNQLKIDGNLNNTMCYPRFLQNYLSAISRLGYIDTHMLRSHDFKGNKNFVMSKFDKTIYFDLLSKLEKLKQTIPIESIKNDVSIIKSFLKKNAALILHKKSLKEYADIINSSSSTQDVMETIFAVLDKQNLSQEALLNYLKESYASESLTAHQIHRIWQKYYPNE